MKSLHKKDINNIIKILINIIVIIAITAVMCSCNYFNKGIPVSDNIATETPNDTDNEDNSEDNSRPKGIIPYTQGTLRVDFIDIGQGDSIFIMLPDKKSMLIDSGATPFANSKLVTDHLQAYGIQTIDYLMLTHPHNDHTNALYKVIEQYDVGEFFIPKILPSYNFADAKTRKGHINTKVYHKFYEQVLAQVDKGAILNYNIDTFSITGEDYTFDFYCYGEERYRTISGQSSNDEVNALSPICFLQYKDIKYVFTGDANYITEDYFISNYVTEENKKQFDSTLLKVGHHGSKSSTTTDFLDIVLPEIAVICVGHNVFGHPTKEVLARLKDVGSVIYNTRDNGKIQVEQSDTDLSLFPDRGKVYVIILSSNYAPLSLDFVLLYLPAKRDWTVC